MLKSSLDCKVKFTPSQKNSVGFMPGPLDCGGTCPGCTTGKGGCWYSEKKVKTCYVDKLIHARPNVRKVLEHNTEKLMSSNIYEKFKLFDNLFKNFSKSCKTDKEKYFRLYWSGDIDSVETAEALACAIAKNSDITFWTYTRNFDADCIEALLDIPNLILYLSLDAVNKDEGLALYQKYKDRLSVCYMGSNNDLNYTPCPVDSKLMDLDMACSKCKLCLRGEPIWFKTK